MNYVDLGQSIKRHRQNRNLTQEQLAEQIGISAVFLSQIENGHKKPSFETVYNIALALKVKIDDLLTVPKEQILDNTRLNDLLSGRTDIEKEFAYEVMKNILSRIENNTVK